MAEGRAIQLEESWKAVLAPEFDKPYMISLRKFLTKEKAADKIIYPPGHQIFHALDATPLPLVKVVIIGQDPYHGPGQAHGLCFSVGPDVPRPPSLINIFREIDTDLGSSGHRFPTEGGCLDGWAKQGVLLLNAVLTVEQNRAASHRGQGWERFTDHIVEVLSAKTEGLVFMLWGSYAQKKGAIVDRQQHCVLQAPHPSPLSAHRGFFGCGHFSAANRYLESCGRTPIDWFQVN